LIYFQCKLCHTQLSAQDEQADQQVRCPNCMAAVTVPAAAREAVAVTSVAATSGAAQGSAADSGEIAIAPPKPRPAPPAAPPRRPPTQYGKRYGFNCVYCSSRLEATETMAGHEGQCPTCGNAIVIPILDRYGRLIDPVTKQIIKQDPHPVHAYAAAGDRAPGIVRDADSGQQHIVCAKCKRVNPIISNNCKFCGMPFTMEGTAPDAASTANGFATASLVLGIIGVPFGCTIVVPALALVFGIIALVRGGETNAGRGQAIAGIVCGVLGLGVGLLMYH
jgi:DNA-directed RNA polymerase subunit RPC12/RpoP